MLDYTIENMKNVSENTYVYDWIHFWKVSEKRWTRQKIE